MSGPASRRPAPRPPLRVLLSPPRRQWLAWSSLVSIAIHAAVLALVLLAYRERPERRSLVDEFVTFLVPPDEPVAADQSAPIPWSEVEGTGTGGSGSGNPVAAPTGDARIAPRDSGGPAPSLGSLSQLGDSVLTEVQVDSAVRRFPESAAPEYPMSLLQRNEEGYATVSFIVDTTGLADLTSFQVIDASHREFALAVRRALPDMRFRAAILAGTKVRQLVQQTFTFRIQRPIDSVPPGGAGGSGPPTAMTGSRR